MMCHTFLGGMSRRTAVFAGIVAGALLLSSCQDDITPPPPPPQFSFSVAVRDTAGNPVPGLLVCAWNRLPAGIAGGGGLRARTAFKFDLKQDCKATLSIFDLEGRLVRKLFDMDSVRTGQWTLSRDLGYVTHSTAYRCRLVLRDLVSGNVLFQDSLVAYHDNVEVRADLLGVTSPGGTFETHNRLYFPSLYDLGAVAATSEDHTVRTYFTVLDSIRIALEDPFLERCQYFDRALVGGPNHFDLVWSLGVQGATGRRSGFTTSASPESGERSGSEETAGRFDPPPVGPPAAWKLYPNFPNPF